MRTFEKELAALVLILIGVILFYVGADIAEKNILKSCVESGVYLNQNGLLVCEWRTPHKAR